jgi:hypothetical protein
MQNNSKSYNDMLNFLNGMPMGLEPVGPETSGKTTLTLHRIRESLKNNEVLMYIDMESKNIWPKKWH